MSEERWGKVGLDEIRRDSGWSPLRRHFDIGAFGVNGWHQAQAGETVIGEHTEEFLGHEELYVVIAGRATFTLDGEELEAPTGTAVFVRDPAVTRKAVAAEPGTTVLAVGGKRGEAYGGSPWEENAEIYPLFGEGRFAEAKERLEAVLAANPDQPTFLYNLACAEARLGESDAAVEHLTRAVELDPRFAEYAQTDEDLESIRGLAGFPAA